MNKIQNVFPNEEHGEYNTSVYVAMDGYEVKTWLHVKGDTDDHMEEIERVAMQKLKGLGVDVEKSQEIDWVNQFQ